MTSNRLNSNDLDRNTNKILLNIKHKYNSIFKITRYLFYFCKMVCCHQRMIGHSIWSLFLLWPMTSLVVVCCLFSFFLFCISFPLRFFALFLSLQTRHRNFCSFSVLFLTVIFVLSCSFFCLLPFPLSCTERPVW